MPSFAHNYFKSYIYMRLKSLQKLLSYILLFSIFLSSCKKEDNTPVVKDSEEPQISFQSVEENVNYRGFVEIGLDVTDNSGISKVEVYINDVLVATLTEVPYELSLDTKNYPDGAHAIKAIAYDKEGNKKEVTSNITISNTLLTVIVPEDAHIDYDNEVPFPRWIFISDMEGKTLGLKKYENGQTLKFKFPDDFKGDQVYLNGVTIRKYVYQDGFISTYANINNFLVNVGEEVALPSSLGSNVTPPVIGNVNLTINNVPLVDDYWNSNLFFEGSEGRSSSSYRFNNTFDMEFGLYNSPVNGLYSIALEGGGAPKYKLYENLVEGQSYEEDYNNLPTMTGLFQHEFTEEGFSLLWLSGLRKAGDITSNISLGANLDKMGKIYYPENLFEEFQTGIMYSGPDKFYLHSRIGGTVESVEPFEVAYNVINNSVDNYSLAISGLFDAYKLSFNAVSGEPENNFTTTFNTVGMNTLTLTGTIPIIPAEITNLYPSISVENLEMNRISFTDYLGMNTEEYFNTYVKNTTIRREDRGYDRLEYMISQPNGRKALSKEMQKLKLEESLIELRGY